MSLLLVGGLFRAQVHVQRWEVSLVGTEILSRLRVDSAPLPSLPHQLWFWEMSLRSGHNQPPGRLQPVSRLPDGDACLPERQTGHCSRPVPFLFFGTQATRSLPVGYCPAMCIQAGHLLLSLGFPTCNLDVRTAGTRGSEDQAHGWEPETVTCPRPACLRVTAVT